MSSSREHVEKFANARAGARKGDASHCCTFIALARDARSCHILHEQVWYLKAVKEELGTLPLLYNHYYQWGEAFLLPFKLNRRYSRLYFLAVLVNFPHSSKDSIVEKTHSIIYIVFSNFLWHRFGSLPKSDSLVTKGSVRLCLTGAHTWNLRLGKGCYIIIQKSIKNEICIFVCWKVIYLCENDFCGYF